MVLLKVGTSTFSVEIILSGGFSLVFSVEIWSVSGGVVIAAVIPLVMSFGTGLILFEIIRV